MKQEQGRCGTCRWFEGGITGPWGYCPKQIEYIKKGDTCPHHEPKKEAE